MTEAGGGHFDGSAERDATFAATVSARFLNDLNNGVTHWVWFIGLSHGSRDVYQKLVMCEHSCAHGRIYKNYGYHHVQQVTTSFLPGTVMRHVTSDLPDFPDMVYTYGAKPPLHAAAGLRPDGRFALAVVNDTPGLEVRTASWDQPTHYRVTFAVPELAATPSLAFDLCRTNPEVAVQCGETIELTNGRATIEVRSLELITLVAREPVRLTPPSAVFSATPLRCILASGITKASVCNRCIDRLQRPETLDGGARWNAASPQFSRRTCRAIRVSWALDEAVTHAHLKALRQDLIDPVIRRPSRTHPQAVRRRRASGVRSVVDALPCAVAIQQCMAERNAETPPVRRIEFRIAVNLGDVIVEGDDIYGAGQRRGSPRAPSTARRICISRTVFDHVRTKVDLGFEHRGNTGSKTSPNRSSCTVFSRTRERRHCLRGSPAGLGRWSGRRPPPVWRAGGGIGSRRLAEALDSDADPASVERMAFALPGQALARGVAVRHLER